MPLGKHAKIAIGWTITVTAGIYLFYLSKASVDRHRYENMKIRERMKQANIGEYDTSVYQRKS